MLRNPKSVYTRNRADFTGVALFLIRRLSDTANVRLYDDELAGAYGLESLDDYCPFKDQFSLAVADIIDTGIPRDHLQPFLPPHNAKFATQLVVLENQLPGLKEEGKIDIELFPDWFKLLYEEAADKLGIEKMHVDKVADKVRHMQSRNLFAHHTFEGQENFVFVEGFGNYCIADLIDPGATRIRRKRQWIIPDHLLSMFQTKKVTGTGGTVPFSLLATNIIPVLRSLKALSRGLATSWTCGQFQSKSRLATIQQPSYLMSNSPIIINTLRHITNQEQIENEAGIEEVEEEEFDKDRQLLLDMSLQPALADRKKPAIDQRCEIFSLVVVDDSKITCPLAFWSPSSELFLCAVYHNHPISSQVEVLKQLSKMHELDRFPQSDV
ncbi:hypothetical protein CHS0354_004497 [Potamilus streckersoni]|uniref:Uncharacterized protein n=1 Tax=Potamilus streckersoni TaxID=2493646 RepID=A0AAE0SNR9_9BIVA|nr:hypothetical protein CHS0354_004497 [Potamilus streckersoni]